jgi:hypothetical protein
VQKAKKNRDLFKKPYSCHYWSFIDQSRESHGLYGPQRIANTLSTEAPTENVLNFEKRSQICGKAASTPISRRTWLNVARKNSRLINIWPIH